MLTHRESSVADYTNGWRCPSKPVAVREPQPIVFVIEGGRSIRDALQTSIETTAYDIEPCASVDELLAIQPARVPGCVVIDLRNPVADALEVQRRLAGRRDLPVILIAGAGDVRVAVEAMKAGAVDVITPPADLTALLRAIESAMTISRAACRDAARLRSLRENYELLTRREREVMTLVVAGLLNKQIAYELGISEITVKAHRGQVTRKMRCDSVPHLVRMASRLGVACAGPEEAS